MPFHIPRQLVLVAALSAIAANAHAQLPGETRESARPLAEEGVPGNAEARRLNAESVRKSPWVFGAGASVADNASVFSTNATYSMTGATKFEVRGSYLRRDADGASATNGFGANIKLFLPPRWTSSNVSVAAIADGRWDIDAAQVWSVSGSADLNLSESILGGISLGYHERQPEEGSATSDLIPAVAAAVVPRVGTEVRLQYRLNNDLDGEDRSELSVAQRFSAGRFSSITVRGSVAKHGVLAASLSITP